MSPLNIQENVRSCTSWPVKKTPREARPHSGATEALQQFLRDNSPPAASLPSEIKRLSGTSLRHSRSKTFFTSFLRGKTLRRRPSRQSHITYGSLLPHNCELLRQVVPGRHQEYYRIVRNSQHFDSLETRSIFRVNYEFRHHNVDETRDRQRTIGKRTANPSFIQHKSPHSHSTSTRIKPRFRLRPGKFLKVASKNRSLSGEKSTCSQDNEAQRGRSSTRVACASGKANEIDSGPDSQSHKTVLRNCNLGDLPQIGDLPAGKAFPASDLIRSIKSIRSSPGKIQSARSKKGFNLRGNINLRHSRSSRPTLPTVILPSSIIEPHTTSRSTSVPPSPNKCSKQLASPVKLSGQKHTRPNMLNGPTPLMMDLATMALNSNPSKSLTPILPNSPIHFEVPIADDEAITPGNGISCSKNSERESMSSFSIGRQSVLDTVGPSTPLKKIASMSIEIGSPTTPPPRTPLPPVPRISPNKYPGFSGYMRGSDHSQGASRTTKDIPAKSSTRTVRTVNAFEYANGQAKVPQLSKIKPTSFRNIHPCDRVCEEVQSDLQSHYKLRTPDLTRVEWPKPPKTHSDAEEPRPENVHLPTWQKQKDNNLSNRVEKTNSLKRRHLQSTPERLLGTRGKRDSSIISRAIPKAIAELPIQQDEPLGSAYIAKGNSPIEVFHVEADRSHTRSQKKPNLIFSGVKTDAIIKPLPTSASKYYHKPPSRTVYRSHSTQMTPGKREDRLQSESSMSNDESILIHVPHHADSCSDSDQMEDHSERDLQLPATQNGKVGITEDGQWTGLVEVVFNQMDRMMASLEDRLSKKLSEEVAKRLVSLEERMHRAELAGFQFADG